MLIPNLISIPQLNASLVVGLLLMSSVGFVGQMGMVLGFKYATAGISSLLMLSIIPFTAISGVLIFNETLNIMAWFGIGFVILALAIIGRWQ